MKKNIILILKGFIIGFGKILPGVSGSMLAISLGIYEKAIIAINDFFKNIKENTNFLFCLAIGIVISIISTSKVIVFLLNNYYFTTMLLFAGLIIGGFPSMFKVLNQKKSKKKILFLLIPLVSLLFINFTNGTVKLIDENNPNFFIMLFLGIIEAITMIVPGLSGTAILMMLGSYEIIINTFSNLTDFNLIVDNLSIIIPFLIGIIIGVLCLIKIISYLLSNYKVESYCSILGFAIYSIIILGFEMLKLDINILEYVVGILLLWVGFLIGYKLDVESS